MNQEQIKIAADLWRDGCTMLENSKKLGVSWSAVKTIAARRRDIFPYRKNNNRRASPFALVDGEHEASAPSSKPGCVVRTTITGAKITLPRVVFIDGPDPESEAA